MFLSCRCNEPADIPRFLWQWIYNKNLWVGYWMLFIVERQEQQVRLVTLILGSFHSYSPSMTQSSFFFSMVRSPCLVCVSTCILACTGFCKEFQLTKLKDVKTKLLIAVKVESSATLTEVQLPCIQRTSPLTSVLSPDNSAINEVTVSILSAQ